jgi:3-hydroxyisobutyrate dehydrogenase
MGANMARRMKDCGYEVSAVYDIRSETASELAEELGTTACSTLAQVTELSEVIITVVIDDASMKSIFAAKDDSLLTGAEGRIFINCATISPSVHIEVEGLAKAAGAESLEGCMASSITQARDGTLYLMLGGEKTTYDKVEELLGKLSVNKRYVGTSGKAAQVKALVNMVMNINTAGLAEGLGLADSLGLDINTVMEIFSQTGANSRVLETDGEDMRDRDHECYFSAAHAAKDSGIALALGQSEGLNLPMAAASKAQFEKMVEKGIGELDKSGVAELTFKGRTS